LIAFVWGFEAFTVLASLIFILCFELGGFHEKSPEGIARPDGIRRQTAHSNVPAMTTHLVRALKTWQWYGLWAILFFNTLAAFPSFPRPHRLAQETAQWFPRRVAASLVGSISDLAKVPGRFSLGLGVLISSDEPGYPGDVN